MHSAALKQLDPKIWAGLISGFMPDPWSTNVKIGVVTAHPVIIDDNKTKVVSRHNHPVLRRIAVRAALFKEG